MQSAKELSGSLRILAVGTALSQVFNLTLGVMIVRVLDPTEYGHYATLIALATIVAKFSDMGLPQAYIYFYRSEPRRLSALLRLLVAVIVWSALIALVVVAIVGKQVLPFVSDFMRTPSALAVLGILIVTGTIFNILLAMVMASGNYTFFAALNIAINGLQLALIGIAFALNAVSLEFCLILAAVAQLAVVVLMVVQVLRVVRRMEPLAIGSREVLSYGLRAQWGILIKQTSSRIELLFVASALSPALVGMYSLANNIRDAGLLPLSIYMAPLQNLIIDRNRAGQLVEDRSAILGSILLQIALGTVLTFIAALALPLAVPLVFGQAYVPVVGPAIILFSSVIFIGAAGICWVAFNAKGRPELTSLSLTLTGLLGPFVVYLMAIRYGLYGASSASALMSVLLFVSSFTGLARLERYVFTDLQRALRRAPRFVSALIQHALAHPRG